MVDAHQPGGAALRNLARKDEGAALFIHTQDGAHHRLRGLRVLPDGQREAQCCCRQLGCKLAEVVLVQVQCRPTIEFVQHLTFRSGDPALRPEVRPSSLAAKPKLQAVSAKPDGHDGMAVDGLPVPDPGAAETVAVACQTAGNRHLRREVAGQCIHQRGAIDLHTLAENQHRPQPGAMELGSQPLPGSGGVLAIGHGGDGPHQLGGIETDHGHAQGVVAYLAFEDLTCGGASHLHGLRQGVTQGLQSRGILRIKGRAKGQHQGLRAVQFSRQRPAPAGGCAVGQGDELHRAASSKRSVAAQSFLNRASRPRS